MTPADPLRAAGAEVLGWLFPPTCLACGRAGPGTHPICPECVFVLSDDPHEVCPRCSSTVGPHVDASAGCGRCVDEAFAFERVTRLGGYDGALRDAVLTIKSLGGELLAYRLGELFGAARRETLLASTPDVIIPVPAHWRRRWARGYNPCDEIASGLSARLGVPTRLNLLRRTRFVPKQTDTAGGAERRRNPAGSVRCRRGVPGLRVLLVDDVLTTGATCHAAASALFTAGAAQVSVAVLAHR